MDRTQNPAQGGYGLKVEPLHGRVTAWRGDILIAETTRAKVMYETRLHPVVYFPREDIKVPMFGPTDLQTFCPFKGTAQYATLEVAGERLENAVWSYKTPLPESREVAGYVGLMPGAASRVDTGDNDLQPPMGGHVSGPVVDWLLREAWMIRDPDELAGAFGRKLVENGVAVKRIGVMIWSLHPMIAGRHYVWHRDEDIVNAFTPSYEIFDHPGFINSPLRHVSNGLGGVRQIISDDNPEDAFPIISDLRSEGATDYVAMPMPYSTGQTNVLSLTCDAPGGFTTANLGLVFECAAVLSRYFEVFTQRENAQSLLETYVGRRTGARVLGGDIRRGDGDEIDAAIMFCDLRGSTRLSESMDRDAYLDLLNTFFETVSEIVHDHAGEVLKFIGDAVLAVFPSEGDPEVAKRAAMESSRQIVLSLSGAKDKVTSEPCDCGIGIAFGRVTYGNVGSKERLDFTVIGRAANVAARLGDYGKTRGHKIVVSDDALANDARAETLGEVSLHNVAEPVLSYSVMCND